MRTVIAARSIGFGTCSVVRRSAMRSGRAPASRVREDAVPRSYAVDVRFKLPLPLPSRVTFGAAADGRFAVRTARDSRPHLEGAVTSP